MSEQRVAPTFVGNVLIKYIGDSSYRFDSHFADDCDISPSTLSKIISGNEEKAPSIDFLWRMSYVLAMRIGSGIHERFGLHKTILYDLHKGIIEDEVLREDFRRKKETNDRRRHTRDTRKMRKNLLLGIGDQFDQDVNSPKSAYEENDYSDLRYSFFRSKHPAIPPGGSENPRQGR